VVLIPDEVTEFFLSIDLIHPATLSPWGRLRNIPGR
jgi:hypothetical protein